MPNSIQPISGQELRQHVFCREERRNIPVPVELTSQVEGPKVADAPGSLHATKDDVLVAAAMKGEATAFAMLVERHERRIFFTALRMTHNREDAEDVVQESLQKAFIHFDSFVGRSSFSTWLTRVAMNEALMLLRKKRGIREVLIDDLGEMRTAQFRCRSPIQLPIPKLGILSESVLGCCPWP